MSDDNSKGKQFSLVEIILIVAVALLGYNYYQNNFGGGPKQDNPPQEEKVVIPERESLPQDRVLARVTEELAYQILHHPEVYKLTADVYEGWQGILSNTGIGPLEDDLREWTKKIGTQFMTEFDITDAAKPLDDDRRKKVVAFFIKASKEL